MECPRCGAENSEDLKFCGYCGSSIQASGRLSGLRNGVRRISENPKVGFMPIAQRGIYWAEFPRKQGRVLLVMTPIKVSALQAREAAGTLEMNPLVAGFGARAKLKDSSSSRTVYETRVMYKGPSPTKVERHEHLEKIGRVLSSYTGSEISSQEFLVTSSTEIVDEEVDLSESVTVTKLGRKLKSLE